MLSLYCIHFFLHIPTLIREHIPRISTVVVAITYSDIIIIIIVVANIIAILAWLVESFADK